MLNNYFKIALRHFRRQNLYSIVNLVGLTLSMSCVILLFLYLRAELSFDRSHPNKNSFYRVISNATINGSDINTPTTPPSLAPKLEVDKYCRITTLEGTVIGSGDRLFTENSIYKVEPTFFELFKFEVIAGEVDKFSDQNIIITPALSEKLFGTENPIGRTLRYNSGKKQVIAVVESPARSHLDFSAIVLDSDPDANWAKFSVYTYFSSSKNQDVLRADLANIYKDNMEEIFLANNSSCSFDIQKVSNIHLTSHLRGELELNASKANIYAFIIIAAFMLVVSGINYSNMAIARSVGRSKEIGIRKAIGSYRSELIMQFLVESVLLVFFGIFLSLIIVDQILPYFNFITGLESYDISQFDWQLLVFVTIVVIMIGVLGGLYPAVLVSRYSASEILKGTFSDNSDKLTMRRILVIIQFSISILMVISTWFVRSQISYINNKNLGYSSENLITVEIPLSSIKKLDELKNRFKETELLSTISVSQEIPGETAEHLGTFLYLHESGQWRELLAKYFSADNEFINCLEVSLLEGANFSIDDSAQGMVLVNESFAKSMGNDIIPGTSVRLPIKNTYGLRQVQIAGVINDFHFRSLHEEVQPLIILYDNNNHHLLAKMEQTGSVTLEKLRYEWNEVYPEYPFDYEFIEDRISNLYRAESLTGRIFGVFAIITSSLAFLGLFALSFYTSELRKKEISIRKINGAGIGEILYLVNREYVLLVIIATAISWPAAYYIVDQWLGEFAYRIGISWQVFAVTLILSLFISLGSVSINTIKAAKTNIISILNRG